MPQRVNPPDRSPRVALLTAGPSYPVDDVDRAVLVTALDRARVDHHLVAWDDDVDWSEFDAVWIRSTWDYTTRWRHFLSVLEQIDAASMLLNPLEVVRWNVDKGYLGDLSTTGIPVVPGQYLRSTAEVTATFAALEPPVVVKPVVSAGAKNSARHDDVPSAQRHAVELLAAGHGVMVQPYVAQIDRESETGLVYLNGTFSHSFAKAAILDTSDGRPRARSTGALDERIRPRQATWEQRAVADRVVEALDQRFGTLLYTRVDLLPSDHGPRVLEVELVEPNLFLALQSGSADVLVGHLLDRLAPTVS